MMAEKTISTISNKVKTIQEMLGLEDEQVLALPSIEKQAVPAPQLPVVSQEEEPVQEIVYPIQKKGLLSRDAVLYPVIFLVALGFFYVVLNFRAVTGQIGSLLFPPRENQKVVLGKDLNDYNIWIKKYYFFLSDPEIIAANHDADHDGLTNHDEFYLGTNPFDPDTDNDHYGDGREVLNGYNPLYEGKLTTSQQQIIAKNLDREAISSRERLETIAGRTVGQFEIDTARPGHLSVPRLGLELPVIWSRDFASMESDLKFGVAHHPETVYPGELGTASIHGHSSGYPWDGNFKNAFTRLNFLEAGDDVFATVYGIDGSSRRLRYVVRSEKVFAKNDPAQFNAGEGDFLNLSTSWPVGTAQKRYVVTAELAE